jgi:hypothetical protein
MPLRGKRTYSSKSCISMRRSGDGMALDPPAMVAVEEA